MGRDSAIEWTDHTFNPWWGCTRVSDGCRFCYADREATRRGFEVFGPRSSRRELSESNWAQPRRWDRAAAAAGRPARVFCGSMCDVFEQRADLDAHRTRLWELIDETRNLIWLLLTKRPEAIGGMVPWRWLADWPRHVWPGTSIETQHYAELRIPALLALKEEWEHRIFDPTDPTRLDPARLARVARAPMRGRPPVLWLSVEPLLGPVDLSGWIEPALHLDEHPPALRSQIGWVIVGGESGPHARPMHPDWARSLRDQCTAAGVPFFFKQWGEHAWERRSTAHAGTVTSSSYHPVRVGKKAAGRTLDGRTWDELPALAEEAIPA